MFLLRLLGAFESLFLINIILLRIPKETAGLASFTSKSNLLGSPNSARRSLNTITAVSVFIYLGIAIQLNLLKSQI